MTRPLSDAALARVWERVQASGDPELMAALDELMDRRDDEPDPAGETIYPPDGEPAEWLMDPDRIAYQLHRLTVDLNLEWPTRPAGNP